MAFDFSGLKNLPNKIGSYLASDAGPVAMGMGAQATMAEHPLSWQNQLGKVAVELGRSNIASKAANRQAKERNQLANLLSGALRGDNIRYTEDGRPGPTTATYKTGSDGSGTFTLKGNNMMNQSNRPLPNRPAQQRDQAVQPSGSPQSSSGTVRPNATPVAQNPNSLLPFQLASAVTGGGGTGGDLRGLTPEQITAIGRTDILGQEGLGRGVGNLYSNIVKQAQADYYSRLPQKGAVKSPMSFTDMKINTSTGTWSYFDRVKGKMIDTGIRASEKELSGQGSPNWTTQEYVDSKGIRRKAIFKDGVPVKDLGVVPESTIEDTRDFAIRQELAEIEARIESDDFVQSDLDNFNSKSDANYFYVPTGSQWGSNTEKLQLPPGIKARDMYTTLQKNKDLTIEQIIAILK